MTGRTTKCIRDARIEKVNGKTYTLTANDATNSLYGGTQGWSGQDFTRPKPMNCNGN